jgi:hypothetical protein
MIENGTPKCDVKAKARAIIASLPVLSRGDSLKRTEVPHPGQRKNWKGDKWQGYPAGAERVLHFFLSSAVLRPTKSMENRRYAGRE